MAKEKTEVDQIPVGANMRQVQVDFMKKAAESAGIPLSRFNRELMLAGAEKQLGKTRPDAKEFTNGGARSPITVKAEEAGVSVAVMTRRLALQALGKTEEGSSPKKARKARGKGK